VLASGILEYDEFVCRPFSGAEIVFKKYNFLNDFADVYVSTQFMS
jgi:hypothetical protein